MLFALRGWGGGVQVNVYVARLVHGRGLGGVLGQIEAETGYVFMHTVVL